MKQQKDEPHKSGPTVITVNPNPLSAATNNFSSSAASTPNAIASSSSSSSGIANSSSSSTSVNSGSSSRLEMKSAGSNVESYDVVMCGGTLGLLVATVLQQQGYTVCIVEKRKAEGRTQEWNTSREELKVGRDGDRIP